MGKRDLPHAAPALWLTLGPFGRMVAGTGKLPGDTAKASAMPHMTIDYSANLDADVDVQGFCDAMRDAMIATGMFPLGGIRVRALACQAYTIADGDPAHAYLHMTVRVGHGRDEAARLDAADRLYAAAEAYLRPLVANRPFALSLDLDELHPVTSLKRFNTLHAAVKASV